MSGDGDVHDHVVPLPGGTWRMWRLVALRGAGFSAERVLHLAAPRAARAIDALLEDDRALDAEALAAIGSELDQEMAAIRRQLVAFGEDPAVREALVWQNRAFARRLRSWRSEDGPRNWRKRQRDAAHARTMAMYMQRYCAKNDTIGFFGPVGWARIVDEGPALTVGAGNSQVDHRTVSFENWAIQKVADAFAKRCDIHTFVPPRLSPFLDVEGNQLVIPFRDPVPLTRGQAAALKLCDGTHTLAEICALLLADPSYEVHDAGEVVQQLQMAEQLGAVSWTLTLPIAAAPEARLREAMARCDDEAIRDAALAELDELVAAKDRVARAAGDPDALDGALAELEQTFARITGDAPSRRAGEMYAGRSLVYEDCRRAADVRIGPPLLEQLGPALTILLDSARWFSWEVARKYQEAVESRYAELAGDGQKPVIVAELFRWFEQTYMREGVLELAEAERALQDRWAQLIPVDRGPVRRSSSELLPRAREIFSAPRAGWPAAYFAPDVMLAADSVEAICRGEFVGVLGEMHYHNTVSKGPRLTEHPDVEQLSIAAERDYPGPHVAAAPNDDSFRTSFILAARHHHRLQISPHPVDCPGGRPLRIGELVAGRQEGVLVARSRDGRVTLPAEALLGLWLQEACSRTQISLFPLVQHCPRVTLDNLVISRERWRFHARELDFVRGKTILGKFAAARRLAREHRLPRFAFGRVRTEVKPIFLDFESPMLIDCFARMIAKALANDANTMVTLSEMLPAIGQTWLPDGEGRSYTAEFRLIALDSRS